MSLQSIRRNRSRGFTLIELLIVITILAILSALGLSVMAGAEQDALETRTKAGIERISLALNKKFEDNIYRILPVRLPVGSTPQEIRDFRLQVMAEFLRVEFPFLLVQADPGVSFPQNTSTPISTIVVNRPQISSRYWAKISGATTEHQSAELLYVILSLNYDESGNSLVSILREREIGDTDGDGAKEVLDAFGDPLQFSLLVKLDEQEVSDILNGPVPTDIVQDDIADVVGYEPILHQTQVLNVGQVRGPWPIDKYRITIRSMNLFNTDSGAVVTQ